MARKSKDVYFAEIADLVSTRSTCLRNNVGALIVKDSQILSTGYNGAPKGLPHCDELGGCLREKLDVKSGERHELCRGLHAEQNAIIQASLHGVCIKDSILYCTHHPCIICTKMIINAGIKKVIFIHGYPDELSQKFLLEGQIVIKKHEDQYQP